MVKVTGIDVVIKSVAVEAGKTTVVMLPGCVETDSTVLVCPKAVVVMVTVNEEAGKVLVIVDSGTSERDVLTDSIELTKVVVSPPSAVDADGSASPSSAGFALASILMAENEGSFDSICPFTSE